MKIAYISADRGIPIFGAKGASVHVRELVGAFAGLDQEVTIFAAKRGSDPGELAAEIIDIGNELSPSFADVAPSAERLGRAGKEDHALALSDALLDRVLQHHRESPFDLIYERYSLFSTAGVRAAKSLGIPCHLEVNSPLLLEQQRYRQLASAATAETVEAEVFGSADALLAVSQEVASYAIARGAAPGRVHVVPNGVDRARFHPAVEASEHAPGADRFVVGFSGSLKPWHGIDVLLDAFKTLAPCLRNYHLLIVGDGPLRSSIQQFADDNGLHERISITGWMPHDELPGLIKSMDVAVAPYPNLADFYFSPLKLYEYMAIGVPIIASRVGQITETLDHRETALLVEPGNADELAASIENLRRDSAFRRALGSAAALAARNFTWEGNARRILELAEQRNRSSELRKPVVQDPTFAA